MKLFLKAFPYLVGFTSPIIFLIAGSLVSSMGFAFLALMMISIILGIIVPQSFQEYAIGAFSFGFSVLAYLAFKNGAHVAMGDFWSSIFVPFAMCICGWLGIIAGSFVRELYFTVSNLLAKK